MVGAVTVSGRPLRTQALLRGWRACAVVLALGCGGNPLPADGTSSDGTAGPSAEGAGQAAVKAANGEAVTPPFAVSGELEGLLVVWFDAEGAHTAAKRSDIPEQHRQHVRVDSLAVAPDKRLDAEHVYVADVRTPGEGGRYPVRKQTRAWLEAQLEALAPAAPPPGQSSDVTLYMASWCGACKATARYFDEKHVAYTEKDIEKDAAANAEMHKKAEAAGKTPRGIPVIDFRGEILLGFDRGAIDRLIAQQKPI